MKFIAQGTRFALTDNTRFPIFDGALVAHKLDIRNFGPDAELDFDAHLEPISMPLLSKAFGWPTLNGQLAGRVPGVSYRDHVLAVQGDLSANVFDGTIIGSRLKLSDPFGPWPRLDADVTARHLDLDLLTHTFSIGSISGRLDADIKGLELFNWSPVAFDARLQTTPGDKSDTESASEPSPASPAWVAAVAASPPHCSQAFFSFLRRSTTTASASAASCGTKCAS